MSKKGYHRSQDEIRRDRAIVAEMYLKGETQHDIAAYLEERRDYNYNRSKVANDIQRLRETWEQSALMDFHRRRAQELAKIDLLEQEYWEAWEESREPYQERTVEGEPAANEELNGHPGALDVDEVSYTRKEPKSGNPQFLRGIQWCINKRCELLGLDAPDRTMTMEVDFNELTDEQLERIIEGEPPAEVIGTEETRQLTQ